MQDEHSIENKMTAREFFTRFPSLHGFLHQQLQKAAEGLESRSAIALGLIKPLSLSSCHAVAAMYSLLPSPLCFLCC